MSEKYKTDSNGKNIILLIGGGLIIYFLYMRTSNQIINSPKWLFYSCATLVFTVTIIFGFRVIKSNYFLLKQHRDKYIYILMIFFQKIILTWFLTGIVIVPFNYYNIYISQKSPLEIVYCDIEGLVSRARNSKIYYVFNDKQYVLYGHNKLMDEIYEKKNYKDYKLTIKLRRGLFNSYTLDDWEILNRNDKKQADR